MGVISYEVPINAQRMTIGVQGENNVREFLFDVTEWRQLTGDIGTAEMVIQRRGDSSPYAAVITMHDENTVSWIPVSADTAKAGAGKIQLMWIANGQTVKTKIFDMKVDPALDYQLPDDSLDPWASWMPGIINADANVKGLTSRVDDLQQRQTSPYNFKGAVATLAALPSTGQAVNDTYYVEAVKYRVTWTGDAWQQSSMEESKYTNELADLKNALNDTASRVTKIEDNSYSRSSIEYTGYDMDRALTATGKEVVTGSVILSFPVTAGSFIKVNFTNRTDGDILYFFQDTKTVPWDSNAHIIGDIHRGSSFVGYLFVPTGATHIVTNANTATPTSYVYNVGSYLPMKYYGQLSSGSYTDVEAGVYAVSRANVSGLPSEMSQGYGWLICYVKNNLYALVESDTSKTIWLKEGRSDWLKIRPSRASGSNRLGGKLIAYNGDSIAESRFSGFASNGGGYPYLISQIVGGRYENKAVSGGTLAVSSASHHVCETISTMTDNADIICIDGGINDYWLDVPLGDFNESDFTGTVDNTTICGALESIFRQAINKWIGKPIVFVIVHKITTTAWTRNGAGYTFAEARQKIIGICEKYSIPYVDMWANGGLNAYMSALDNAFLNGGANTHPDGCHPDVNGYQKYYVPRLIAEFESLLPYDI